MRFGTIFWGLWIYKVQSCNDMKFLRFRPGDDIFVCKTGKSHFDVLFIAYTVMKKCVDCRVHARRYFERAFKENSVEAKEIQPGKCVCHK